MGRTRMFDEIIEPIYSTEWGRRAGWGVLIGASLLCVYTLFASLTAWYSDISMAKQVRNTSINESINADGVSKLITQIPQFHIFGKANILTHTTLPVTSLQIRLVGIVKSHPEKFSRVLISEQGQLSKVYQSGDVLSSGVKVYAISDNDVVLENDGRLEKLPLQRSSLKFKDMPKSLLPEKSQKE